jgi:hypothetical protein
MMPRVLLVNIGVGVHLNQPRTEVLVDHKVVTKELKVAASTTAALNQLVPVRKDAVQNEFSPAWEQVFSYGDDAGAVSGIEVRLKLLQREGVAFLESAELGRMFLQGERRNEKATTAQKTRRHAS